MVRIRRRMSIKIILLLLASVGVLALLLACTSGEGTINPPPSQRASVLAQLLA
jgi:hypothetical protein